MSINKLTLAISILAITTVSTVFQDARAMQERETTDLMHSVAMHKRQEVEKLKDKYIRRQDNNGNTALMYAGMYNNFQAVSSLKDEMRMQNDEGETALMMAAFRNYDNFIPLVMEELGMQDNKGQTALHRAAGGYSVYTVGLLLQEADIKDNEGMTALYYAAKGCETGALENIEKILPMTPFADIEKTLIASKEQLGELNLGFCEDKKIRMRQIVNALETKLSELELLKQQIEEQKQSIKQGYEDIDKIRQELRKTRQDSSMLPSFMQAEIDAK